MRSLLSIILMMVPTAVSVAQGNASDLSSAPTWEILPAPAAVSTPASSLVTAAALGDLDGDGDLDAVVTRSGGTDELYRGDGSGELLLDDTSVLSLGAGSSLDVELADLDNDGLLDVVIVSGPGETNRVYVHESGRSALCSLADLSPNDPLLADRADSRGVALADLDHDGWVDVVVACFDGANGIYVNRGLPGPPSFQLLPEGALPDNGGDSYAVVVEDADDDGDSDILFSNRNEDDFVYLARGETEFDFLKITSQKAQSGEQGPGWIDLGGGLDGSATAGGGANSASAGGSLGAGKGDGGVGGGTSEAGGSGGAPRLLARSGSAGSQACWSLQLENVAPHADCLLVIGLEARPSAFHGGLLLPRADLVLDGLAADDGGQLLLSGSSVLQGNGSGLVFQAVVVSPGSSSGYALSNGLRAVGL